MEYFHCWSGGKDSTASIILDRENGLPPSTILCTEVMFDKKRQISGELPEHIDFIKNKAKPLFESWGYKVEILHSKKDYLDLFYHVVKKSSVEERKGKYVGWLLGGMCSANRDLKVQPLYDYYKERELSEDQYTQYVGIAIDEPKRLERLRGTNKVSLLEQFNYTEEMAYQLCKKYDLLSPGYEHSRRGGCWFCPNTSYREFAHIKEKHPELWAELRELDKVQNVVSHGFKYGKTLQEVEVMIEKEIERQRYEGVQLSLFDYL